MELGSHSGIPLQDVVFRLRHRVIRYFEDRKCSQFHHFYRPNIETRRCLRIFLDMTLQDIL
jgi:hypothetical protein